MTMPDSTTIGLHGERFPSPDDHGAACCFSRQGADPPPDRGGKTALAGWGGSLTNISDLLVAIIQDQAQLSGLFNTLYDMGFSLVKAEAL
jgi:hypothetical protein